MNMSIIRINNTTRNITTRDNLGIEGVATSMSGQVCPVVNTVTPRPYFWAFVAWCYYDCYRHTDESDWKREKVQEYVKRINYFIALGTILVNKNVVGGFPGSDTIRSRVNLQQTEFDYDAAYLKNVSTITYYFAGLDTMELVVEQDKTTMERFSHPMIRPEGKRLALAFDEVVRDTKYYKEYRFKTEGVPRTVLEELGYTVNVDLSGFDECRTILIQNLFERKRTHNLSLCKDLVNFVLTDQNLSMDSTANCRRALFDSYSVRGENRAIASSLRETANNWEVIIGRQYFTVGLEMIWQYMLSELLNPMDKNEWINHCIASQSYTIDIRSSLSEIADPCMTFEERERQIHSERRHSTSRCIENAVMLLVSIYYRFKDRTDFSAQTLEFYYEGINRQSISFHEFFEFVEESMEKPVEEFIRTIMDRYLIRQHLATAFEKMLENRDGYYIEHIGGKYYKKENFVFDFQGNRMVQLFSVMSDLEVIGV